MRVKRWNVAAVDESLYQKLRDTTDYTDMVCGVIAARNHGATLEEVTEQLHNKLDFESPFLIKDMEQAVNHINQALEEEEQIVIYGDYDCDGVTSTALLMSYFQSIGADVSYYIPKRESEGYGMNKNAVATLHQRGTDLIITVDNGISAHEEVDYANELGIDVVITDHHTPRETLPNAIAVVNPHRKDCPSQFKEYAGVGVAFQLVCALEGADPWELLDYYADLVTIGTVADLVPLIEENRTIVEHGIELLEETTRPGIGALIEIGGLKSPLSAESVSFGIAPRINAAGRMDQVDQAVELLLTEDEEEAKEIAQSLQGLNLQRRGIEEDVLIEISKTLSEHPEKLLQRVLVVWGKDWHQGVLGIVASRLLERYGKPCIVFSVTDGIAKGSGRSLEGFSLIDAISACNEPLTHYGGHTLAAGMTLAEKDLEFFDQSLQDYAKEHYEIMPVPSCQIDKEIAIGDLTIDNIESLNVLAPFGAGNPSPIFVLRDLTLTGVYPTADQKHMRLKFNKDQKEITAIFFRMSPQRFPYQEGDKVDIVISVDINEWNGNLQLSTKISDIRSSIFPEQEGIIAAERYQCHKRKEYGVRCKREDLTPSREELATIYRYLVASKGYTYGAVALWEHLLEKDITLTKIQVALDIFEESGLITRQGDEIAIVPQTTKVDLSQTKTLKQLALV